MPMALQPVVLLALLVALALLALLALPTMQRGCNNAVRKRLIKAACHAGGRGSAGCAGGAGGAGGAWLGLA